jgi:maltooligosyltrehalose trehalohydrolase
MTEFRVWAPFAKRVRLVIGDDEYDLVENDGWWTREVEEAGPGTDYWYLLDDNDELRLPDPRSLWQPAGVHGPSRVYDHAAFTWTDRAWADRSFADRTWTGRPLPGAVIYELHIGTFTIEGTFDAAIERLDHLANLGVDLVELLPVAAFNGEHGWGYDGVAWFAPHEPYGGPDGLKRFVDAAHARGLGVVLDVVYNHFGPSGAYAPMFGPYLATGQTDWGQSINLDGPLSDEVRQYIVDNALAWLRDYHVDALRLDAVHALIDRHAVHLLELLAVEVDTLSTQLGRPLTLIAESDRNDPRHVTPREAGGYGLHAQWDDDFHHAVHALLTGERQGYYVDFGSPECLAAVLTGAFWHAGTYSAFRQRTWGRPVDRHRVPGHRFVAFLQNHDQIGNRATGDRLVGSLSPGRLRIAAVLLFTAPFTPMLFMGEEWGATTPWQYFTSHPEPDLADAVVSGRRREFAAHGWPAHDVPNPQDEATFVRSKLDWSELENPIHQRFFQLYRSLIALRKATPDLADPRLDRVTVDDDHGVFTIQRGDHHVIINLTGEERLVPPRRSAPELVFATEPEVRLAPDGLILPPETAGIVRFVP